MTGPEAGRLLNAAYRVATEPTPVAYGKPWSSSHTISRRALLELLEALAPMVAGTSVEGEIRRRLAHIQRAGELRAEAREIQP